MKVKKSDILNAQGRAILLDVCGRRQLQVCQNPDLLRGELWLLAVKHKKKEMDGDSLLEGKFLLLLMVMENK